MNSLTITPPADYHLSQSLRFLSGFTPQAVSPGGTTRLRFATPLSPDWITTAITVTQPGPDLVVEWSGDVDGDVVADHVRRILSIDIDADGLAAVIKNDSVVGSLIDPERGFRPPLFWSPYEAAVWAVLSQRVQMKQASNLKTRLASAHGAGGGEQEAAATPEPYVLAKLDMFEKLPNTKTDRLRAVARAALDGRLDPTALRQQPPEQAAVDLQEIVGIGPFSAELILVRGAGAPDVFPANEKRLHAIMRDRYELPDASIDDLAGVAEGWSPYRSWIGFQFRAAAEQPPRIG